MPPSLMAMRRSGKRSATPDHSQSTHAASDSDENRVAPISTSGPSSAMSIIPLLPTCRQATVPVSAHAASTGSHQPECSDG